MVWSSFSNNDRKQFAARVGASLLNSLGLNELVVSSRGEYEDLCIKLARDNSRLRKIREHLDSKLKLPLFDSQTYTKNFEMLLTYAHQRQLQGKSPVDLSLKSN